MTDRTTSGLIRMSPVTARPLAGAVRYAPAPAAGAPGLQPRCYLPSQSEIRAYGARLIMRRTVMTLAELACIAVFVGAVWVWAAIATGSLG